MTRRFLLKRKIKKYIRQAEHIIYSGEPNGTELIMKSFIATNNDIDLIYRYIVIMLVADFKRGSIDSLCFLAMKEIDSIRIKSLKKEDYKNLEVELFKAKAELVLAKRNWQNILDSNMAK